MHLIQKNILKNLLFREKARFSQLNNEKITNDHFTFHLKRLMELGLVGKSSQGFYSLTTVGKEYANRMDAEAKKPEIERQAKLGVVAVCLQGNGKNRKYLIQQRLKHPSFGFYGFISGKIKWGETIFEAVLRELGEETGLKGQLSLEGIEHKIDYSQKDELLEDKFFYITKVINCQGDFKKDFQGGKNFWLTKKEVKKLPEVFGDVFKIMELVDDKNLIFVEEKYKVSRY